MSKKSARRGRVAALRPEREAALLDLDLSIGDTEDLTAEYGERGQAERQRVRLMHAHAQQSLPTRCGH